MTNRTTSKVNILVLGGHGFVGRNVVEVLRNSNHTVLTFSRRNGLDLTNYEATKKHFKEISPEVIINCAAKVGSLNYVTQEAAEVFDVNMRMLLNMYKVVQETVPDAVIINPVGNCAFPGSLNIYKEELLWSGGVHRSVLSYGSTRRMILVLSECYSMQYGLRSINYFVPNMYGPYDSTDPDKAHALNALISKVVKVQKENRDEIEVWGTGVAVREWLYAKDFARILLETIKRLNKENFNTPLSIAQNYGLSIKELVEIIVQEVGFSGRINWNRDMPDGALCKVMDDTQFRKVFPYFKFTELIDGIRDTIKYYESIYPY